VKAAIVKKVALNTINLFLSENFSWDPVSSTNITDHHDITEILLKIG
jgi:hypothetical protein